MKKKRIHCPKCNKLMPAKTQKCKFCEKKLVKINKEISIASLYVGWIVSMLVFYAGIFYLRRTITYVQTSTLILLTTPVVLGLAFFSSLVKKLLEPKKKDDSKHWGKSTVIVFILFFVVLYNYETVEASLGFSPPQTQNSIVKTRATPKPTFTLTPTPKPTSKPQQTVKPTSKNTTKPNPNTPVHCPINEKCGGGTIPLKASECKQSTCCETSPGNWEFIRDRNDCNNGSNTSYNPTSTKKVSLYIDDSGGITKGTFYCYEDKVNYLSNLQNQIRIDDKASEICKFSAKIESEQCKYECENNNIDLFMECLNPCIESKYDDCRGGNLGDLRIQLSKDVQKYCP